MTQSDPVSIAARMERLPNSGYTWRIVLLVSGALIIEALDIGSLGAILPILKKVMALGPSQVGLLAASSAIGIVLGMIPAGYLADRYGRKPLLLGGMLWFVTGTVLAAFSPNFTVLVILRGLSGIGMAATFIMPFSIVSEFVSRTRRGAFAGVLESSLGIGYLLPPILGLVVMPLFPPELSWRVFLVVAGLPLAYIWVIWRYLPESPRWLSRVGRHEEADRVVRSIEERVEKSLGRPLPPPRITASMGEALLAPPPSWRALALVWRPPYLTRTFAMIIGAAGISSMFYLGVNYIPTLFVARHIALTNAFLFTLLITAAQIPGKLLNGVLGEIIGRKRVYILYTIMAATAALLFGQSSTSGAMVAWGAMMWFFAPGSASSYKIWYAEQYPTPIRATGQGTVEAIGGRLLGGVIWTSLFPILLANLGIGTTMMLVAAIAAVALVVVSGLAPETFRQSMEELEANTVVSAGDPALATARSSMGKATG